MSIEVPMTIMQTQESQSMPRDSEFLNWAAPATPTAPVYSAREVEEAL